MQIAFHADIAREAGDFQIEEVLRKINSKLVRRHPHVFSDGQAKNAREVEQNWEQIKAQERNDKGEMKSPVQGIPANLPALAYAQLMHDRVSKAGFECDDDFVGDFTRLDLGFFTFGQALGWADPNDRLLG